MKTHLTLQQLAAEITRRQEAKKDFIADTRTLHMTENADIRIGESPEKFSDLPVNGTAHQQIATRLGIPVKYYDKMKSESPQLLANNVNHWFKAEPEKRMIRTLDGTARAFLSDRYNRIENEEIAQVVLPELLSQDGVKIASCSITETKMYIKAVFTRIQREVKVGEIVQAGVCITNSEVGYGAANVDPFVETLACTNGMVIKDARFSARHIGGRITSDDNSIMELLSNEALQADDRAITLKIRDVVRASFDEVRFTQHVNKMSETAGVMITGNPVEAIKLLGKKLAISEGEQTSILRHLIEGADLSQWGLLSAVTRTAQDQESYDRATELETIGGNILYFTPKEFAPIAQAA